MSALRETTVNRIGTGNAGAGRYTFKNNRESDLELESEYDFHNEADTDACFDSESAEDSQTEDVESSAESTDTQAEPSLTGLLDDDELAAVHKRVLAVARYASSKVYHLGTVKVDADDAAQEAMIKILIQKSKGKADSLLALGSRLAKIEVGRQTYSDLTSRNRTAFRIMNERVSDMEGILQRKLSPGEYDAIAAEIRKHWAFTNNFSDKQASLPSKDFHHHHAVGRVASFSQTASANEGEINDLAFAVEDRYSLDEHTDVSDYWVNKAIDTADGADDGVSRPAALYSKPSLRAKKYAWNGIAELSGLPVVEEDSISNRQIKKARKDMAMKPGRVVEVIREWEAGIRNESTEALFAPFGATTPAERSLIADKLMEHSQKLKNGTYLSDSLWESAASCAGRRSATS